MCGGYSDFIKKDLCHGNKLASGKNILNPYAFQHKLINFETTKNITLMKRLLLFSIAIILILCSCNYNNETRQKLVLADTLLYQTKNDSAMKVLKSINAENLKDESNRAYYNLLMTQTLSLIHI
mgnify:CR=1 FL=1